MEHLEGSINLADGPSRWPDYEIGYERPVARLLATASLELYDNLRPASIAAQTSDNLAVEGLAKLVYQPMMDGTDTPTEKRQWEVVTGVLTYKGRIYVQAIHSLCQTVISLFHDIAESGHFGAAKTTELVSRDFYWPVMDSHVHRYVSRCEVCHRIKAPRHVKHGINMPLKTPSRPWAGVMMDFVTDLP